MNVNGTFGYNIGLTAEAEASYLGILAGRIKTDIGAEVEIGAGWSGEWTEVVMQQQATVIPICHEQVREGEIRKVTAVWRTPYGQMLSWDAECGSTPFHTTSICQLGELSGNGVAYKDRLITITLNVLREGCVRECPE